MKRIVVMGVACLSLVGVVSLAGAQNQTSNNAKISGPRDAASGQASGKQAPNRKMPGRESSAPSVSEAVVKAPSANRESSAPSVSEVEVTPPKGGKRVAAGDVNGDGRPDVAVTAGSTGNAQNAAINNSHSNIKNAREAASGQASGKRQHEPLTIKKEIDAASPNLRK